LELSPDTLDDSDEDTDTAPTQQLITNNNVDITEDSDSRDLDKQVVETTISKVEAWKSGVIVVLGLILTIGVVGIAVLQTVIFFQTTTQQQYNNVMKLGHPINLQIAKTVLTKYYLGGQYQEDLQNLVNQWIGHFNITDSPDPSDVIVFDIDETILSSYSDILAYDYAIIPKLFSEWIDGANASVIPETYMLYTFLQTKGFKIAFITGRNESERQATRTNLHKMKIDSYETLIMRNSSNFYLPAAVYKNQLRAELVARGYRIVGTVGDQLSDFAGDNVGHVMKVPNYCYFIA